MITKEQETKIEERIAEFVSATSEIPSCIQLKALIMHEIRLHQFFDKDRKAEWDRGYTKGYNDGKTLMTEEMTEKGVNTGKAAYEGVCCFANMKEHPPIPHNVIRVSGCCTHCTPLVADKPTTGIWNSSLCVGTELRTLSRAMGLCVPVWAFDKAVEICGTACNGEVPVYAIVAEALAAARIQGRNEVLSEHANTGIHIAGWKCVHCRGFVGEEKETQLRCIYCDKVRTR
jgi:hypothetical protein